MKPTSIISSLRNAALFAALILLVIGCSSSPERIETQPDFTGFISGIQAGQGDSLGVLLVESHANKVVDKYQVTLTGDTGIFEKEGQEYQARPFDTLVEKQWVQVWFTGPVKESFPAQVDAAQVVIFQTGDASLSGDEAGSGTLMGQVSIGPLSPVAQEGVVEPTPIPEMYDGRMVVIYDETGQTEVDRVQIGPDGSYQIQLPAGSYTVDINHIGIDFSKDLPQLVQITDQQTTRLDFTIDTGIR